MFRSRTKYNSTSSAAEVPQAGSRRGLRDITNTATNAVKPVGKKGATRQAVGASLRPLPARSSFGARASASNGAQQRSSLVSNRMGYSSQVRKAPVDEIDRADVNNPMACTEYVNDIHEHFRQQEVKKMICSSYMNNQSHINEKMRAILIDWLVEVNLKFKLVPETLYLNVAILDMFLAKSHDTARNQLQLVGVTALLIAAKYEEIYPPEIRDLVYITDRAYTKTEILRMEAKMLKVLGFKITQPSPYVFLARFLKAAGADSKQKNMANYICERALQEYSLLQYKPSMVAAASVYMARRVQREQPWTPLLEKHSHYSEGCISNCVNDMRSIMNSKSNLTAVQKKYSNSKYGAVSGSVGAF